MYLTLTLDDPVGGGERRRLDGGSLRIGRAPGNDWELRDAAPKPTLSRQHCVIEATGQGFTVTDLGSRNGTLLNDRPLPAQVPTPLAHTDRLRLGPHLVMVGIESDSIAVAPVDATLLPPRPKPPTAPQKASAPGLNTLLGGLAIGDTSPAAHAAPTPLPAADEDPLGEFLRDAAPSLRPPMPPPRANGDARGDHAAPQLEAMPIPQRRPAAPTAQDALLVAFLNGAGLTAADVAGTDTEALMRDAGRTFAAMAAGLRDLLATRSLVRDQSGIARTMVGAVANNPLKHAAFEADAARALLARRQPGDLDPQGAVRAGVDDLEAHQMALLDGMQAAMTALLAELDPTRLEGKLAEMSALAILLKGGRRSQLWRLYTRHYAELAEAARVRFMGEAHAAFAQAYDRRARSVRRRSSDAVP